MAKGKSKGSKRGRKKQTTEERLKQQHHQQRRAKFFTGMEEVKGKVLTPHYSQALNISDKDFHVAYGRHMKDEAFVNASAFDKRKIMNDYFIEKKAKGRVNSNPGSSTYQRQLERERHSIYSEINAAKNGTNSGIFNFDSASNGAKHAFNENERINDFFRQNTTSLTNQDIRKRAIEEYEKVGLTRDNYHDFVSNKNGFRDNIFTQSSNNAGLNPTMMDHLWGNKVPQIAGGALLTAGLVSSMSNSKGQQSNAELYNQAQPYY
ncbi:hypothetical protein [Lysinibacillus fusiformis]|uniref:hypothetical protein n=1 Tax=Lysinibacillus fusiformis TaxID=28031 RepID=UPI00046AD1A3|nr:hypothetical protein [Lysinibacillus fusiformis]